MTKRVLESPSAADVAQEIPKEVNMRPVENQEEGREPQRTPGEAQETPKRAPESPSQGLIRLPRGKERGLLCGYGNDFTDFGRTQGLGVLWAVLRAQGSRRRAQGSPRDRHKSPKEAPSCPKRLPDAPQDLPYSSLGALTKPSSAGFMPHNPQFYRGKSKDRENGRF